MTAAEASLKLVDELPDSLIESVIGQLRRGVAPVVPNPGYQTRIADFLEVTRIPRQELAAMLEVASPREESEAQHRIGLDRPGDSGRPREADGAGHFRSDSMCRNPTDGYGLWHFQGATPDRSVGSGARASRRCSHRPW